MSRPNTVKPESYPDAAGVTWRPRGADSRPTVAPGRGAGSLGLPGSDVGPGGPASKVDRASSPESEPGRPGPPANRREVSNPPRGGLSGRGACQAAEAVESPVRVFSRVRPPWLVDFRGLDSSTTAAAPPRRALAGGGVFQSGA